MDWLGQDSESDKLDQDPLGPDSDWNPQDLDRLGHRFFAPDLHEDRRGPYLDQVRPTWIDLFRTWIEAILITIEPGPISIKAFGVCFGPVVIPMTTIQISILPISTSDAVIPEQIDLILIWSRVGASSGCI